MRTTKQHGDEDSFFLRAQMLQLRRQPNPAMKFFRVSEGTPSQKSKKPQTTKHGIRSAGDDERTVQSR